MSSALSNLITAFVFGVIFSVATAGAYEMTRHTTGSSGQSSGGPYVLDGTIGQAVTEPMKANEITLESGFWSIILLHATTPGGPLFEDWINNLPPEHQPPPDQRGFADTPAGDGMTNFLKFTLGLLPMVPSREDYPRLLRLNRDGEEYIGIEFARDPNVEAEFTLETSENLQDWQPSDFTEEHRGVLPDGREVIFLLENTPAPPSSRHFLRLAVGL